MSTKILGKNDIFGLPPVAPVRVELPGGVIHVRKMCCAELDRFEIQSAKERKSGFANFRGRLVAVCACDEKGKRLFDDDDAHQLGRMPAEYLDPIATAALEANGMGEKGVASAEKNSSETPGSGSATASPSESDAPSKS
jgi:hypothetical protein